MRRLVGGAIAVLFAASAFTGGSVAQEAAGRFALAPNGDGFLRLDTQTGAVSYCRLVDGRWSCEEADTGGLADAIAAINERLGAIDAELAALREAFATPPAADPALAAAIAELTTRIDAAVAAPATPDLAGVVAELRTLGARLDTLATAPTPALPAATLQPILDAIAGLDIRLGESTAANGNATAPSAAPLDPLVAAIRTLTERVDALATAPAPQAILPDTALEPLRAEMAALSERIAALAEAHSALTPPLPAVPLADPATAAALADIGQRLVDLEADVAGLGATPPDPSLAAAIAALGGQLDAVQVAVTALAPTATSDPAASPRLAAIESRLEALTVAVSALRQQTGAPVPALDDLRNEVAALVAEMTTLAGLPAAVELMAGRIDAVATQQAALAATPSAGITPADLAAVAQSLREELAAMAAEVDRIGTIATTASPDVVARLDAIDTALAALAPAADAAAAPVRDALASLATDMAALRQATDGNAVAAGIATLGARIAALERAVATLVPAVEMPDVAAGAELRGTGIATEPTTFGDELRRRLFGVGAALRRGLGG